MVHNRGDQAAVEAVVSLEPGSPFNLTDGPQELGTVEPGKSSSARFRMVADMEAPPGPRPVSCNLSYLSGRILRQEDRAVVLEVERDGSWGKALGGALLLAVLALAAVWLRGRVEISGLWRRRPGRRKW
ncbi:MAG: hypothetical protein GKC10_08220 [Methanosarcinales archaeon]|nr:hypothetical protein [Methanosarcinales archaeon]